MDDYIIKKDPNNKYEIIIGKYTYGHDKISVLTWGGSAKKIIIGKFCSIANCTMFLGGNHNVDWITTYPFGHINTNKFNKFKGEGHPSTNGDIVIGNDVWIAKGVTIMSGVKIGDGAVIASNSHVVKDVDSYEIVGGNPAKHIKYRFDKDICKKLLSLKWWDLEDEKINELTPILCSTNIEKLLNINNFSK